MMHGQDAHATLRSMCLFITVGFAFWFGTLAFSATTKPALPPAPPGVKIVQDVDYLAKDRSEKLDVYLPATRATDAKSPAVILIHGGGWVGGDKAGSREFNIATTLA